MLRTAQRGQPDLGKDGILAIPRRYSGCPEMEGVGSGQSSPSRVLPKIHFTRRYTDDPPRKSRSLTEVWESKNVVTEEAPVDGEQHKVPGC